MSSPRTAVVTIAHGRHEHLRGQGWGLLQQTRRPDDYVVVAMGDAAIATVARELHPDARLVELPADLADLPLAEARNAGAEAAVAAGAEALVFLDVDCIPAPTMVERYAAVLASRAGSTPVVACGEVRYLPPVAHPAEYRAPGLAGRAEPHPARPAPQPDTVLADADVRLFWSLSFALRTHDWEALGGFDEAYSGYGAEDTDFGQRLAAADGELLWVGGAAAYHQHHTSAVPPVQHLHSIVRNANVFHDRWGWFPMEGWLAEFEARHLAELDPTTGRWRVRA
ncbi:glycosyltransferase family 2 protein [Pedococcus bigeumensis]|uniref:glycosyltransferase family 2 protein n=1 Tax=Pedococcus bigeumensis TaxID=433644 RepID=UPI002FE95CDE